MVAGVALPLVLFVFSLHSSPDIGPPAGSTYACRVTTPVKAISSMEHRSLSRGVT